MKIYQLKTYCSNCPSSEYYFDSMEKAKDYRNKIKKENNSWAQIDYYINEIEVK